jgi:hypothetical protein
MSNIVGKPMGHTKWIFLSQPNYLHTSYVWIRIRNPDHMFKGYQDHYHLDQFIIGHFLTSFTNYYPWKWLYLQILGHLELNAKYSIFYSTCLESQLVRQNYRDSVNFLKLQSITFTKSQQLTVILSNSTWIKTLLSNYEDVIYSINLLLVPSIVCCLNYW